MKINTILTFGWIFLCGPYALGKKPDDQNERTESTLSGVIETLKLEHPRLLVSGLEDFDRLKNDIETDPDQALWFSNLLKDALRILTELPSKLERPDGRRLLSTSIRIRDRIYTLAMAYRLTGDERFPIRAWEEMLAVSQFSDWNPRHYLDTAEITNGFAIGYDWLYDVWTTEQRTTIATAIIQKGLQTALPLYRNQRGFVILRNNWNPVCNGGIGMGALAIADEEPTLAEEILSSALSSIPIGLRVYGPDGGWNEGPAYWRYTTVYTTIFLAGLESALGTDFGLSRIAGFAETCLFPIYMSGPTGLSFNFADSRSGGVGAPAMFWLAKKFNQPACAEFQIRGARGISRGTPTEMLWYDNTIPSTSTPSAIEMLPLDKYYRKVEVATFRSSWNDYNGLFAGLKVGDNRASHGQLDLGSFVLDAYGYRWAEDLGPDNYTLPGYFSKTQRWNYYRNRAEGHNTLVMNLTAGPDQGVNASARITQFYSDPMLGYAIADLSRAYRGVNVKRGLAMMEREYVIVQDEISSTRPREVWWFMHTLANITLDGKTAVLTLGNAQLTAEIISPPGAIFSILPAEPFPTSPKVTQSPNSGFTKLTIQLRRVTTNTTIMVLFSNIPQDNVTVIPLAEW